MSRFLLLCLLIVPGIPALGQVPQSPKPEAARMDRYGDPLPAGAVTRLGTTRFRHQGAVGFAGYSGDGALLMTAGTDGLRVWDARAGKELRKRDLKQPGMRRFPFQPAPSVLLSADANGLHFVPCGASLPQRAPDSAGSSLPPGVRVLFFRARRQVRQQFVFLSC